MWMDEAACLKTGLIFGHLLIPNSGFVLRNVNKGIKIITFCDIKKKMFVILHNNYKVEENMEIFLRLLLVLVVLFPMSEVTALTDKNSDIWREKSDVVDIAHQTLSKMHKLEKTICQMDSEGEKEPTDSGCSFPPLHPDR